MKTVYRNLPQIKHAEILKTYLEKTGDFNTTLSPILFKITTNYSFLKASVSTKKVIPYLIWKLSILTMLKQNIPQYEKYLFLNLTKKEKMFVLNVNEILINSLDLNNWEGIHVLRRNNVTKKQAILAGSQ